MIARRKPKVLVWAPIDNDALAILQTIAEVQVVHDQEWAQAVDGSEIDEVDAVVTTNGTALPATLIERGARLRVIGRTGGVVDPAVEAAAHMHGVQIVQASHINGASINEHDSVDIAREVCEQVARILRRRYTIDSLSLHVVPVTHVILHENHDDRRVAALADRLVADGKLVNPPITIRRGRTYIVLDGATRMTAFRHLGYPYIVVQEVDVERFDVRLRRWLHAVHGGDADSLLRMLSKIPGLALQEQEREDGKLVFGDGKLGYLHATNGRTYRLEADRSLQSKQWLDVLNRMVADYSTWGTVERTSDTNMIALSEQFPTLAGLFEFPTMQIDTLMDLALEGYTIPAGITRFQIPGRVLHLNAPLDRLIRAESLVAKRQWLEGLLHERMVQRQVRHYEEPVILLDE